MKLNQVGEIGWIHSPREICYLAGVDFNERSDSKLAHAMYMAFLDVYKTRLQSLYGSKYTTLPSFLATYNDCDTLTEGINKYEKRQIGRPITRRSALSPFCSERDLDDQLLELLHEANWMHILRKHFGSRGFKKQLIINTVTKLVEGGDVSYITGSGQRSATTIRVFMYEREGTSTSTSPLTEERIVPSMVQNS